jgi:hypothetical protein
MDKGEISIKYVAKVEHLDNKPYYSCEMSLNYKGVLLNPEANIEDSEDMRRIVLKSYWDLLVRFILNHKVVVRISGLHFNVQEFLGSYLYFKDRGHNIICHHLNWPDLDQYTRVMEKYALIECDDIDLLKSIFDEYWFVISAEWQTEILILNECDIAWIEPWSRKDEGERKNAELIDHCIAIFDNMHNGFHFRVISNKENEDSLKSRVIFEIN